MQQLPIQELKDFLDYKLEQFNVPGFIEHDPISIPHRFSCKEDIEISGFLTATLAWGNRMMIIRNATKLIEWMDETPYEFLIGASNADIITFNSFVHRTFQGIDCQFFIQSLAHLYKYNGGIEAVFNAGYNETETIAGAIMHFRKTFLQLPHQKRTEKHIANVYNGSSGKRLNMFLRWMVRSDRNAVDFGIWNEIPKASLMLPLDVHTGNVSRKLGLLKRKQNDWKAVEEVTTQLRLFDKNDPVKYDFALFGLGIIDKF